MQREKHVLRFSISFTCISPRLSSPFLRSNTHGRSESLKNTSCTISAVKSRGSLPFWSVLRAEGYVKCNLSSMLIVNQLKGAYK
jgi:hypothetical protein